MSVKVQTLVEYEQNNEIEVMTLFALRQKGLKGTMRVMSVLTVGTIMI